MPLNARTEGGEPIPPRRHLESVVRLQDSGGPRGDVVRLDKNERVEPFGALELEAMRCCLTASDLSAYPDFDAFCREIAAWVGVDRDMVLVTAGSDQAIKSVFETYVDPGDTVVVPCPTFAMYGVYCEVFQADRRDLFYTRDLELSAETVCEALRPGTRLLALPNPNAPTGTLFDTKALEAILGRAAACGTLVLVDEAYYGFSEVTAVPLVERFWNLVVTRTFSKACGLAGVRLGFMVSAAPNIRELRRVKPMYEASGVAMRLGQFILRNDHLVRDYARAANEGKAFLKARFEGVGQPFGSECNFLVVRMPPDTDIARLVARVREAGFLIKGPFSDDSMQGCIRITTGPVPLMERFWKAFETVYASGQP